MSTQDDDVNEISPEDFTADEQDTTAKAAPSTAEKKEPEAKVEPSTPAKEEPKTDPKEEKKSDDPEQKPDSLDDKKPEDSEKAPDAKPKGAEERKDQLSKDIEDGKKDLGIDPSTEIRDMVSARNAIREAVEKKNAETYAPATVAELTEKENPETGEKYSSVEAKIEAMNQANELREYNERVADAQLTITSEVQRVVTDFPIFNPKGDDYDKELAQEAYELFTSNLIVDDNTQEVIGANMSPYKIYQTLAKAHGISATKAQIKGKEDAEEEAANADSPASSSPAKKPADPLADLWKDEL